MEKVFIRVLCIAAVMCLFKAVCATTTLEEIYPFPMQEKLFADIKKHYAKYGAKYGLDLLQLGLTNKQDAKVYEKSLIASEVFDSLLSNNQEDQLPSTPTSRQEAFIVVLGLLEEARAVVYNCSQSIQNLFEFLYLNTHIIQRTVLLVEERDKQSDKIISKDISQEKDSHLYVMIFVILKYFIVKAANKNISMDIAEKKLYMGFDGLLSELENVPESTSQENLMSLLLKRMEEKAEEEISKLSSKPPEWISDIKDSQKKEEAIKYAMNYCKTALTITKSVGAKIVQAIVESRGKSQIHPYLKTPEAIDDSKTQETGTTLATKKIDKTIEETKLNSKVSTLSKSSDNDTDSRAKPSASQEEYFDYACDDDENQNEKQKPATTIK